jgi:Phytanoyl-CoA dioxygenase (PhyH)
VTSVADEETYVFDVQGFIKLRRVLDADEVKAINALFDRSPDVMEQDGWHGCPDGVHPRNRFLELGDEITGLVDHPKVLPFLTQWVDRSVRLDHCYGIFSSPGDHQLPLHHGGTPHRYYASYTASGGVVRSGMTVVSWALTDIAAGAGTFTCIPGSHKAAFDCPPAVRSFERDLPCVVEVPMSAGDVLIFSEALTHGARPWRARHRRRSLLFKYAPACLAWSNERWPPELLDRLTPRQRRLFRGPWMHDVTRADHGFRSAVEAADEYPILQPDGA